MNYKIIIDKPAQKFILKQPPVQQKRLLVAISKLPDEGDRKPLRGHAGFFRLRVGDYRIIYSVEAEKLIVRVINAGNRGDVYK